MVKKTTLVSGIASLGLVFGLASGRAVAQMPHDMNEMRSPQTEQTGFRRIEQPISNKVAVTLGGFGLIGLELWWFLLSKPKSRKATAQDGVQEVTVTVDGGYEPSQIVVQAGQPVRLNFDRKDPSSCLEEVRFPDFRIAQELPLNQVTPIEFIPDKPGRYEFTCGMNMFRGIVEVQAAGEGQGTAIASVPQPTHHADHSVASASSVEAMMTSAVQEATVTVAKGYQPKRVIVEAGYPVRLHFDRQNPSSCYDQLLIPDFAIAVDLPLNETTTIEFIPEQLGEYEFMCGMKMNRGVIEVRASHGSSNGKATAQASI